MTKTGSGIYCAYACIIICVRSIVHRSPNCPIYNYLLSTQDIGHHESPDAWLNLFGRILLMRDIVIKTYT